MDNTEDIRCPDCEETIISKEDAAKYDGKCFRCYKRKLLADRFGNPYTRIKDLTEQEREEYLRRKEANKKYREGKREERIFGSRISQISEPAKKAGRTQIYTEGRIEYMRLVSGPQLALNDLILLVKDRYPEIADKITYTNIHNIVTRHNIPFKKVKTKTKDITIENNTKDNPIESYLKENASEDKTILDLVAGIYDEFKAEMTRDQVYKIVHRLGLPFKQAKKGRPAEVVYEEELKDMIEEAEEVVMVPQGTLTVVAEDTKLQESVSLRPYELVPPAEIRPARFKPIEEEVNETIIRKFQEVGCRTSVNYITKQYIEMLEMLNYLSQNFEKLIEYRKAQKDIMNSYQADAVHEQENVIAKEGDTYLSDKLHVIRDQRRYYDYDETDLSMMSNLFIHMKKLNVSEIIDKLKELNKERDTAYYIPLVDKDLVSKYKWAISGDGKKDKKTLRQTVAENVSNLGLISSETVPQVRSCSNRRNYLFRVSAELSGGGYGVCKQWYKDYWCYNTEIATRKAKQDLEYERQAHPGMIYKLKGEPIKLNR